MFLERLISLLKEKHLTRKKFLEDVGLGKNSFINWEKRGNIPSNATLSAIAAYLGVSVSYLKGESDERTESKANDRLYFEAKENIYMIPVFGSVSAGFGSFADDNIEDFLPCTIQSKAEAEETICITVVGDSMFPKIEEGDIIQVKKQSGVDSGSVAVALIDGEEAVVKKIIYGDGFVELHSFNPMYPVRRFTKKDVLRVKIIGLVKKVIKNL